MRLVRNRAVTNPDRSVRLALSVSLLRRGGWAPGVPAPQYVAFATEDRATVRYRLLVNGGEYACTIDVQWSRDDWRLVLGTDGSTSSGCSREIPAEFTPWGP